MVARPRRPPRASPLQEVRCLGHPLPMPPAEEDHITRLHEIRRIIGDQRAIRHADQSPMEIAHPLPPTALGYQPGERDARVRLQKPDQDAGGEPSRPDNANAGGLKAAPTGL